MKSFKQFVADNDNQYKVTVRGKSGIPNTGKQHPRFDQKEDEVHSSVARWHDRHVSYEDGSSVTTTHAYESYVNHCVKTDTEPLTLPSFHQQWADYSGHTRQRIAGRMRHIGVSLSPTLPIKESVFGPHNAAVMWRKLVPHMSTFLHGNAGKGGRINLNDLDPQFPKMGVLVSLDPSHSRVNGRWGLTSHDDGPASSFIRLEIGSKGHDMSSPESIQKRLMHPMVMGVFAHEHEHHLDFEEHERKMGLDKAIEHFASQPSPPRADQLFWRKRDYKKYLRAPTEVRAFPVGIAVSAHYGHKSKEMDNIMDIQKKVDPKRIDALQRYITRVKA